MALARLVLVVCVLAGTAVLAASTSRAHDRSAIGVNVDVSKARGPQSEASIAIDPRNHDVLVAGSNSAAERTMRAYSSTDGGATWTSAPAPPLPAGASPGSGSADPAVGIDRRGAQYFAFVLRTGRIGKIYVAHRFGPLEQWITPAEPVSEPPQSGIDDKPALTVDNSPESPFAGRVYVSWIRRSTFSIRILVSHSDDGGTTWSAPAVVNDDDTYATYPSLATARSGDLYVAWAQFTRITIDRSTDGGEHFGTDRLVSRVRPASTLSCVLIPAQPANCVQHNPVVSIDTSNGPLVGSVYVTYSNTSAKGVFDVFASAFDATLEPVRPPTRVNPRDGAVPADQFWPASAVDPASGRLWACYYDTRGDRKRKRAVFTCTASSDGARTWARPVRAATVPSNEAQPDANVRGYGDYEGLAAADGLAHPIWTDSRRMRTLREEIYTAVLDGARLRSG